MQKHHRAVNHMTGLHSQCMCCGSVQIDVFYEMRGVPVNSVLLLDSLPEALCFNTRDIVLGICRECGFISNVAFDESMLEYSSRYESTQSYSPTYNHFANKVAKELIDRFGLRGKRVIEIGCGQGEFLTSLCELGGNSGLGFDPAYIAAPQPKANGNGNGNGNGNNRIHFIADYYSERYADQDADFICCKMTLEHVHDVDSFMKSLRKAIGRRANTVVFFQVPNAARILEKGAIWDIYYEHCSYFSPSVLAHLFVRNGFQVLNVWTEYDDQYVLIEARPNALGTIDTASLRLAQNWELSSLISMAAEFAQLAEAEISEWNRRLDSWQQAGLRGAIWGGGSKAVAFLSAIRRTQPIGAAVDINPKKHGTYLPLSGLEVVAPEYLVDYKPDFVIVMNPVYMDEIRQQLASMGVKAHLVPVE